MIGIYKITNKINGKIYIGQSIHIEKRWKEHRRHYKLLRNKGKVLYQAFDKYGIDNFQFEVLEECVASELDEKEKLYITKLNSLVGKGEETGYNVLEGGGGGKLCGSKNPLSKMNEEDVYLIREMYLKGVMRKEAFTPYSNKISINTFADIWNGKTWKDVHYDVYTEETKRAQKSNFSREKSIEKNRKVRKEDVIKIRDLKNSGLSRTEVFNLFSDKIGINTFNDIWYNKTFSKEKSNLLDGSKKNKKPPLIQSGEKNNQAKLSNEEVLQIRKEKESGIKLIECFRRFKGRICYSGFYNVWIGKSYSKVGEK